MPGPVLVREKLAPEMMAPSVRVVLPRVVMVILLDMVTGPLPMLRAVVPPKVKLPAQVWVWLARVTVALLVLSMVPPLMRIEEVLVPMAPALLISTVPELRV